MKITGTTLIDHSIRVKLKLSLQDYTILSFLSEWYRDNVMKPTEDNFMVYIGCNFADKQTELLISKLIQRNFLNSDLRPTNLWNDEFKVDLSAGFERLWDLHKKGSKKLAMARYDKVVKKITPEELEFKLSLYVQTNDFQYLKGLDVYLNPKMEHWNDPLVYKDGMKPIDKSSKLSGMVMSLVFLILVSCTPVKKETPKSIIKIELIDAVGSGCKLIKADAA